MQTVKEAITILQEKKQGLINYHSKESFICITVSEHAAILSLLSQQEGKDIEIDMLMASLQKVTKSFYELQKWKESALAVMPDYHAIGKALRVPLGQSIHDKILPAIQQLQQAQQQGMRWVKCSERMPDKFYDTIFRKVKTKEVIESSWIQDCIRCGTFKVSSYNPDDYEWLDESAPPPRPAQA